MARTGPKPKRTAREILTVVEVSHIVGVRPAGKLTGIPWSSIQYWKTMEKEGDLMDMLVEKCPDGTDLQLHRDQRKAEFIDDAWKLITVGITRMAELIPASDDLKAISTAVGITMDKLLLLSGEATSRSEAINTTVSREALIVAAMQVSEKTKELPRSRNHQETE